MPDLVRAERHFERYADQHSFPPSVKVYNAQRLSSKLHRMVHRHWGKFVIKAGSIDEVYIPVKQFLYCGIHHWLKGWRHWTDWSGNSGLGGRKLAPTIGRSEKSSFGAWVNGVGAPLLGRVKEVVVVHVQGRQDSRRQGYCAWTWATIVP